MIVSPFLGLGGKGWCFDMIIFMMNEQTLKNAIRQTGKFAPIQDETDPYMNEFQNLLYEQEQGEELALNDSFEQMERSEHSEKNMQIMKQVNAKREKESEEKRTIEGMKEKITSLIGEEKNLIGRNIQLRLQIKKMQQIQKKDKNPQQNQQINQLKQKIVQMRARENELLEELGRARPEEIIDGAVFGQRDQPQLARDRTTQSSMNLLKFQKNPLTISIRSNPNAEDGPLGQISYPGTPNPGISQSITGKGFRPHGFLMHSVQGGFTSNSQGFLTPQNLTASGQVRMPSPKPI